MFLYHVWGWNYILHLKINTPDTKRFTSHTSFCNKYVHTYIYGILPKGPYLPCVSMAGWALLAGYQRYILSNNFYMHGSFSGDGLFFEDDITSFIQHPSTLERQTVISSEKGKTLSKSGPLFTKKTPSYHFRDSHDKPKTVVRPS